MANPMMWRKKDITKLTSYARKFNTSITKYGQKHPELADAGLLPSKIDIKSVRDSDITRKDFNNMLKSIDRWFKPKAREIIHKAGVPMTRWDYHETLYGVQRINYQKNLRKSYATVSLRQRYAKENEVKSVRDKLESIQRRLKNQSELSSFSPEDAASAWKIFRMQVTAQSTEGYMDEKNALYYYNYNKAIYENFSGELATQLSNRLEDLRLTGDELYQITGAYPEVDIEFIYSPEEAQAKFEYIMEMYDRIYEERKARGLLQ